MSQDQKRKVTVWITTSFEAIHHWPSAPEEVAFLRHAHRHIFHVKMGVVVNHLDRDVEFILLKRKVDDYIHNVLPRHSQGAPLTYSCELFATLILEKFDADYVEVSEDGENGARVEVLK